MPSPSLVVALALWLAIASLSAAHVWGRVEPYMDEVFHIPQAQKYCEGRLLEWDPKITTFPGLYVWSAVISWVARPLLPPAVTCSAAALRGVNVLFGGGCLVLLFLLHSRRMNRAKAAAQAFTLSVYPAHFFFSFLYYTDVGSLFWVLLTHHLASTAPGRATPSFGRMAVAACSGLVSIGFRQTNAVWVMFTFGTAVVLDLQASKRWREQLVPSSGGPNICMVIFHLVRAMLAEWKGLLRRFGVLLLPVVLFVGFVVWNGAIVVGDHTNHQAAIHWAQLAYLFAVTASLWGVLGPDAAVSVSSLRAFWTACSSSLKNTLCALAALGGVAVLLYRYSIAHPFLLADNRHYTFYVWRRLLGRAWWTRVVVAPVYIYAFWLCRRRLVQANSELWLLVWLVAAALTLVPAPLLEPRYLTTAIVLAHAHSPERSWVSLAAGVGACLAVHAVTLWIFVDRPFVWVDGSTGRFMW